MLGAQAVMTGEPADANQATGLSQNLRSELALPVLHDDFLAPAELY